MSNSIARDSGRPVALTFEEIYHAYSARILNLTYRMTLREDVARDLTQDVFLKVHGSLESFNRQSQVYTWIHRIAVNHVLNYLKSEKRRMRPEPLKESTLCVVQLQEGGPEFPGRLVPVRADLELENAERTRIVWSAVHALPPKYRIPLILHHFENHSYREIAEMMDLSLSAVETRIHRAKKRLVKILEPMIDQL